MGREIIKITQTPEGYKKSISYEKEDGTWAYKTEEISLEEAMKLMSDGIKDKDYVTKNEFDNFIGNDFYHLNLEVKEIRKELGHLALGLGNVQHNIQELDKRWSWVRGAMFVLVPIIAVVVNIII